LKAKVNHAKMQNMDHLKESIRDACARIPPDVLKRVYHEWERHIRMQICVINVTVSIQTSFCKYRELFPHVCRLWSHPEYITRLGVPQEHGVLLLLKYVWGHSAQTHAHKHTHTQDTVSCTWFGKEEWLVTYISYINKMSCTNHTLNFSIYLQVELLVPDRIKFCRHGPRPLLHFTHLNCYIGIWSTTLVFCNQTLSADDWNTSHIFQNSQNGSEKTYLASAHPI